MISLGTNSKKRMEGLHPSLVLVVTHAAEIALPEQDFMVLEGVRSRTQMMVNYGKGRTPAQMLAKGIPVSYAMPMANKVTWLNDPFMSNHRVHEDGFGHAVDLAPWPLDWNNIERFKRLGALVLRAADEVGVKLAWGGNWKRVDYPHYELA